MVGKQLPKGRDSNSHHTEAALFRRSPSPSSEIARTEIGPSVYLAVSESCPAREEMLENSKPANGQSPSDTRSLGKLSRSVSMSSSSSTISSLSSSSSSSTLSRLGKKIIQKFRDNKSKDSLSKVGDCPYQTADCLFPRPMRSPSKGPAGQETTLDKQKMKKITIWSSSTRDDDDALVVCADEVKTRLLETVTSTIDEVRSRFDKMKIAAEREAKRPMNTLEDFLARRKTQRRCSPVRVTEDELTMRLCSVLEAIFLHGLVEIKFRSFWPVAERLSTPSVVDYVTSSQTAQTEIAKCRIWLRCILNSKSLADVLSELVLEYKFIRKMYQSCSFLNDASHRGMLLLYAEYLSHVDFSLDTGADMNMWTRYTLALSALMQPFDPRNFESSNGAVPPHPMPSAPRPSTSRGPTDELANITVKDILRKGNCYYLKSSRRRLSVHDVRNLRSRGVLPDACPCLCCHAAYVYPTPQYMTTSPAPPSPLPDAVSRQPVQNTKELNEDFETGREELPRSIFTELR